MQFSLEKKILYFSLMEGRRVNIISNKTTIINNYVRILRVVSLTFQLKLQDLFYYFFFSNQHL